MEEKIIHKIESIGIVIAVFFLAGEAIWSGYIDAGLLSEKQRFALFMSTVLLILLLICRRLYALTPFPKNRLQQLEDFSTGISAMLNNNSKLRSLDIYCLESDSYFEQLFAARNVEVTNVRLLLPSPECIENFYKNTGSEIVDNPKEAEINLETDIQMIVKKWNGKKDEGTIRDLSIKYLDVMPMHYMSVANNKTMLYGYYVLGKNRTYHGFTTNKTFVTPSSQNIAFNSGIRTSWFEQLWKIAKE